MHRFSGAAPLLLDGALATELERRGCSIDDPLWSAKVLLEQPGAVLGVHADYVRAGARCLITSSYQVSFDGLAAKGCSVKQTDQLLAESVRLARQAVETAGQRESQVLVAASIGPYGAALHDGSEYRGDYKVGRQQLIDFHQRRMETLIAAGPDLLACETIPCLAEAEVLLDLINRAEFPAWFTFTLAGPAHVSHGESLKRCADLLSRQPFVVGIGVNCCPPNWVGEAVAVLASEADKPVVVYPNSGEIWNARAARWEGRGSPEDYLAGAQDWISAGAGAVGGCCRTTPAHISALSRMIAGRT